MPNHVITRIKAKGIGSLPIYSEDKDEYGCTYMYFDFSKIIPMPKDIDPDRPVNATHIKNAIRALEIEMDMNNDFRVLTEEAQMALEAAKDEIMRKMGIDENGYKELLEEALVHAKNIVRHGATTWYDWSIKNWGTKWNSYSNDIHEDEITFQTAWCFPEPVILELVKKYPDMEFDIAWADEDTGCNTGKAVGKNGNLTIRYLENDSDEAIELAESLWGR